MATYTENYGLHQWETGDDFLREDFNEDFLKIDTAITEGLATKCEIVCGSYTGDSSESRVISLGFRPKAVMLELQHGFRGVSSAPYLYGGIILENSTLQFAGYSRIAGTIVDDGFEVYCSTENYLYTNHSSFSYHYIAFK